MRFRNFFIEYKIEFQNIKQTIPISKLPLYRKIAITVIFVNLVLILISLSILKLKLAVFFSILMGVLCFLFLVIDSRHKNLKLMLKEHYNPYSKERMDSIINLLKKYKIDINDIDKIDLLITEARLEQIQCDYFLQLEKPTKVLASIIIPITTYFSTKVNLQYTDNELINISIICIIFVIFTYIAGWFIIYILKEIFNFEYRKYDELISDLKQIKIFYSKDNI